MEEQQQEVQEQVFNPFTGKLEGPEPVEEEEEEVVEPNRILEPGGQPKEEEEEEEKEKKEEVEEKPEKKEEKKEGTEKPEVIKLGDKEYALDTPIDLGENDSTTLGKLVERHKTYRREAGLVGQQKRNNLLKEQELVQKEQQLQNDLQQVHGVIQGLSSANKKEAIDTLLIKSGLNPATWWDQVFTQMGPEFQRRSGMSDQEREYERAKMELEFYRRQQEQQGQNQTQQQKQQALLQQVRQYINSMGLDESDVEKSVTALDKLSEMKRLGELSEEQAQALNGYESANPQKKLELAISHATQNKRLDYIDEVLQEAGVKGNNEIVEELFAEMFNPYSARQLSRAQWVKVAREMYGSEPRKKAASDSDDVEIVEDQNEEEASDDVEPLSMSELMRRAYS